MILESVESRLAVIRGLGGASLAFGALEGIRAGTPTLLLGFPLHGGGAAAFHVLGAVALLRIGGGLWRYEAGAFRGLVALNAFALVARLVGRARLPGEAYREQFLPPGGWGMEVLLAIATGVLLAVLSRELTPQFRRGHISYLGG